MATIPEGSLLTALRGYVGCPPGHITAVSRLQDGNRHAVYKVSYLGPTDATEDLVVRVSYGGGPDDRAQAEQEARVLKRPGVSPHRCSMTSAAAAHGLRRRACACSSLRGARQS
jgi:hypothetical protein